MLLRGQNKRPAFLQNTDIMSSMNSHHVSSLQSATETEVITFIQALYHTAITPANQKLHMSTDNEIITVPIVCKVRLIDPNSALFKSLRVNVNVFTIAKNLQSRPLVHKSCGCLQLQRA